MAWTNEMEQAAAHGKPMPDGLDAPERVLYIALRGLYYQYRENVIDREQAKREKQHLMNDYKQAVLDEKCRAKSVKLWRDLPSDIMKSDCPKCQEVGKIVYGLR